MRCRGCESTKLQLVLDLGKQPWGNDFIPIKENRSARLYPLELFFCQECSLVQIGYTVPKEEMFLDHNYMSGTTRSLAEHFRSVGREILGRTEFAQRQEKPDYILDVGGNDGTFLQFFKENGAKVINVDSGKKQAERSEANGVFCVNEFFNEESAQQILKDHGPAKVIHGSGVFFHLEELHSAFKGIKSLLAKDGILVAEFIYLPQMVDRCAFDQIYHEHLLYYTMTTLAGLLQRWGLEPFDCTFSEIHGGSCVAYIGHTGQFQKSAALKETYRRELEEGYLEIGKYLDFAARANLLREDLIELVQSVRAQNKRIFALGAPVKGTTIVNYCGWDVADIEVATEINPYKFHTYVPGTQIPVVDQKNAGFPDVYLLLSWNFKSEILSRLEDFFANGGKVIIPIPETESEAARTGSDQNARQHENRILYTPTRGSFHPNARLQ